MSIPAPPRSAFRNHLATKFSSAFKRCMFGATIGSIAFTLAYVIPQLRKYEVALSSIDSKKLYNNIKAAGAYKNIDQYGIPHRPDADDDDDDDE